MQNLSQLIGHTLIIHDTVDSTNNYIANHADLDNMAHGTVVLAWEQTNGRGRFNRKWDVVKGLNLTFSILLKPKGMNAENYFSLSKMVSVSLCEWLKKLGLNPSIKIPNDILINTKKIAGILLENKWQGEELVQQIAGIGINVNQETFEEYFRTNPTSVKIESGISLDLEIAIQDIIGFLSFNYVLLNEDPIKLSDAYHQFLVYDYLLEDVDRIKISRVKNNGMTLYYDDNGMIKERLLEDLKLLLLS